jgi:TrmH family RNA methyltransferase
MIGDGGLFNAENIGQHSKTISEIRALRLKKNIIERGRFIIEGKKAVYETLCDKDFLPAVNYIVLSDKIDFNYIEKISFINLNKYVKIYRISAELFNKISGDETPEGALCVAAIPARRAADLIGDDQKRLFIILDSVNDPGNLGTIMRLADNFGVSAVVCGKNSVYEYLPKVIKSSMGSFKNITAAGMTPEIYEALLSEVEKENTAVVCSDNKARIALSAAADKIKKDRFKKVFLIGGSESHGVISGDIKNICAAAKNFINSSIPNYGRNESLNLSVAMGIFCYEIAGAFYSK